ncbi:DUF3813 domain-containing protein [Virgibacillus flavescens]|uniref:DUF3813 domain-containing protein n=1 Tax=Virgibacillus flavescens TaxID=1611422 RepID=UPI003D326791
MENNFFQQAKKAVSNLKNTQGNTSDQEKQAAHNAIQSAYADCSPEEKQQLQQLEQELQTKNQSN